MSAQDEEGCPAPSGGKAVPGHTRARARWLLACTLHRNPASAAYRNVGDSDSGPALGPSTCAATMNDDVRAGSGSVVLGFDTPLAGWSPGEVTPPGGLDSQSGTRRIAAV